MVRFSPLRVNLFFKGLSVQESKPEVTKVVSLYAMAENYRGMLILLKTSRVTQTYMKIQHADINHFTRPTL